MSHHGPSAPTFSHLLHAATRPSLLILFSYLTGIVLLFRWTLRRSIFPPARLGAKLAAGQRQASPPKLWIALLILSFASTWTFMFRYFHWSYTNYLSLARLTGVLVPPLPSCTALSALSCLASHTIARLNRIAQWLDNTSLFEEAWLLVVSEPTPWWWSLEICTITVGSWALFVRTEGSRLGIPHIWAYMLLGQAVAISVAANLFNLALSLRPAPSGSLMIAHSNRQASDPFGADQLLEAIEVRSEKGTLTTPSDGSRGTMQRTPSQKAMPPPALPVPPSSATRTSRSVHTASVLPLPSQVPSLQSRATLSLLILGGILTVFRIPTSLTSILIMHSFPLILTIRCPVPHAMSERRILSEGWKKRIRDLLAPSRLHFVLGLAGLALKVQTTLGAWEAIHLDAVGAMRNGASHTRLAIPHAGGHELAVRPTPLTLLLALARSFLSNPARSSISSDALCIGLTTLFFILSDARRLRASLSTSPAQSADETELESLVKLSKVLATLTPLLGPSTAFSFYLARREGIVEDAERRDEVALLRSAGMESETCPQLVVRERRVSTTIRTTNRTIGTDAQMMADRASVSDAEGREDEEGEERERGSSTSVSRSRISSIRGTKSPAGRAKGRRSLGEDLGIVETPTGPDVDVDAEGLSHSPSPESGSGDGPSSPSTTTTTTTRRRRIKRELGSSEGTESGEERERMGSGEGTSSGKARRGGGPKVGGRRKVGRKSG